MTISEIGLRTIAFCAGTLLFYSIFLYEDENTRVQSSLEDWWIRLEDQKQAALNRQTVFVREIARSIDHFLDGLLGRNLLSVRAVSISVCYSLSTASATALLLFHDSLGLEPTIITIAWALNLCLVAAGTLPAIKPKLSWIPFSVACLVIIVNGGVLFVLWHDYSPNIPFSTPYGAELLALPLSTLSDLYVLLLARRTFKEVINAVSAAQILQLFMLNLLALGLVILVPYFLSLTIQLPFLIKLAFMNVWSGLLLACPFLVAMVMLVHRVLWPTILRPLYLAQRVRVVHNKSLLATLSVTLLGVAFGPSIPAIGGILHSILKQIIR